MDFFSFSYSVLSQLILPYAFWLDVLIHHTVYMKYFDYTLPILQNFEKKNCVKKLDLTSFKFSKLFLKLELTLSVQKQSAVLTPLLPLDYTFETYEILSRTLLT